MVGAVVVVALLSVGAYAGAQSGDGGGDGRPPIPEGEPRAGSASPTENGFVPIAPCRIVNTQTPAGPIGAGATRSYRMHGNTSSQGGAASCGIPASATALEVTAHAVSAAGTGYLRVFPATGAEPNATFMNYGRSLNQSNTGTIAVTPGTGNNFRVKAYLAQTHVIVDVAGYYVPDLFASVQLHGPVVVGNGVNGTSKTGTGVYTVTFNRNVEGCGFAVGPWTSGEAAATAVSGSTVTVRTYNSAGTGADRGFDLTVHC